ncbi:MAG: Dabb family protein [Vallitaleaceae bacterium]|nr:Dabb family protein [Vallitaleaceae bacterium]
MEGKILRHLVLFKFKDNTAQKNVREIETAFMDLKNKIDVIQSIEWGTDVSTEGIRQGFTHCFFLTFGSANDRDAYLPHPEHKAFGRLLEPFLDKVLVVDYWTN